MTRTLFRLCFFFLVCVGNLSPVYPQSTYYYYKRLGITEGLSQSRVQSVLNDHRGYLWIGTESGLNCYDRDHLKQYLHQPGNEKTLPSNDILFVAEDSMRNLWVGTSVGLSLYDRENDNFITLRKHDKPVYVASYLLTEEGILFGGSGAIYEYAYATRRLEPLYYAQDPAFYTPFWKMIRYNEETVLLNSRWHGIYTFSLKTHKVEKIDFFQEKNYTSIYLDSHRQLWLSAYGNGLYCFRDDKLVKHFTSANSPLTYDVIHDMTEKDNHLWVATDGGGINTISLEDFSFSNIRQMQDDVHSFPANTIYRLYVDPANNIWAGSVRRGLIGIKKVYARSFQNVPFGNLYGLSNETINSFFQDRDGMIWIGTDGGGINRFDPETGTFRHYPTTKYKKVVSIVEYSPDELLFFSFNEGLFIFNKHTGQLRPFTLVDASTNNRTCINGFFVNIQRISESKLLFSAEQVFVYDQKTRKFEVVATMGKEYKRNSPLIITTADTKTYLSDLNSICEYDSSQDTFKTVFRGDYVINDACRDQDGTFWLASTEGLVHCNPATGESRLIETSLFHEATSVVADRRQRIWIGTRRHLYVYSPQTGNFATLDEVDGVLPNEYIFHATLLARSGDILVGGTTGMTLVDPAIQFDNDSRTQTVELLDVLLNGLPLSPGARAEGAVKAIRIPWDFSSLHLKVLLKENDVFRKHIFRFHIEGLDQELERSNSNSLVINYLPEGEYTITASYYTRDGGWSDRQPVLNVVVTPPWWRTGEFYAALCFLLVLSGWGMMYYFQRKKRVRQSWEIARLKNKMYEEKINFLTNISHELRTPLTLICAPLKRIISRETGHEDVQKMLVPIYKQAYQMKSIIDMVLDVRKLEEGKEMLHILPHNLNEWVRTVGEQFNGEFEMKGVRLSYELDERIEKVPFDKNKCEFVLSNYLMNALKFSDSGTTTTVVTTLSPEKDWVRVAVRDEGMGLNLVDADALFSAFYQGEHEKGGSGIGLSYAKNLITHHKGKVGAMNAPDKGAVFYFELPLFTDDEGKLSPVSAESGDIEVKEVKQVDYAYLKNFSVMIVEDTTDLRNYLKETLTSYFSRVHVAKDGKDGLAQIKQRLPDIIISDLMMPRMNGFELCREVKTNLDISHIPFVLLTAYHNSQNMYTGYKTGADAFLPKPFEIDGLLALIYNQLSLREQIRKRYKDDNLLTHKEVSFSNADETFLLKLNTLIMDNMSNPELDVAFLATNMCISRSLLFNKVKAITGMGIIDYVNKQRIEKSLILLNTTSMSLTEIADMVGFSSLRYFSKVFKSVMGEIPSVYRKQEKLP